MNYINENAIATPLRIGANKDRIQSLWESKGKMTGDSWRELASAFISYCLDEDAAFCFVPSMNSYESQRVLRSALRSRWIVNAPNALPN